VPVAHSTSLKENYVNLEMVLEKSKYYEHNWSVCSDLKVCGILLGQQGGYTKVPCFMCEWDSRSREKHWVVQSWPQRIDLEVGTKNINCEKSLRDTKKWKVDWNSARKIQVCSPIISRIYHVL
jgi:hypothetical protein